MFIFALAIKDGRKSRGKPPKGFGSADMPNTWAGGLEADGQPFPLFYLTSLFPINLCPS